MHFQEFKLTKWSNLRVTLFKAEFTQEDLVPLTDEEIIRERYLEGIKRHPNLSPETIPNQLHCIKTLIKVLRGPVTLKPEDTIKTINLKIQLWMHRSTSIYFLRNCHLP